MRQAIASRLRDVAKRRRSHEFDSGQGESGCGLHDAIRFRSTIVGCVYLWNFRGSWDSEHRMSPARCHEGICTGALRPTCAVRRPTGLAGAIGESDRVVIPGCVRSTQARNSSVRRSPSSSASHAGCDVLRQGSATPAILTQAHVLSFLSAALELPGQSRISGTQARESTRARRIHSTVLSGGRCGHQDHEYHRAGECHALGVHLILDRSSPQHRSPGSFSNAMALMVTARVVTHKCRVQTESVIGSTLRASSRALKLTLSKVRLKHGSGYLHRRISGEGLARRLLIADPGPNLWRRLYVRSYRMIREIALVRGWSWRPDAGPGCC